MQYRGTKVVMRDGTDPNQQQVRQDMYHAWKDLQTLKKVQPGDGRKSATRGNLWRVSSSGGQDKIELLGYSSKEKVKKEKKKKIKTNYTFLPAFCLLDPDAADTHEYTAEEPTLPTIVSVCLGVEWAGVRSLIPSFLLGDVGTKTDDNIPFGLTGLVSQGNNEFTIFYSVEERSNVVTDKYPDGGYVPYPNWVPYTHIHSESTVWQNTGTAKPTSDRPGGEITGISTTSRSLNSVVTKEWTQPTAGFRTDNIHSITMYPTNAGISGAYVPTVNEIAVLTDKYMLLYTMFTYTYDLTGRTSEESYNCLGYTGPPVITVKQEFYVSINGEELLLGEINREEQYFAVTDAQIFILGSIVYYVYAYTLNEDNYGVKNIMYGYFMDNITQHTASQSFTPIGLTAEGSITVHHDVAGSSKCNPPVYGIGKCSGYSLRTIEEFI